MVDFQTNDLDDADEIVIGKWTGAGESPVLETMTSRYGRRSRGRGEDKRTFTFTYTAKPPPSLVSTLVISRFLVMGGSGESIDDEYHRRSSNWGVLIGLADNYVSITAESPTKG